MPEGRDGSTLRGYGFGSAGAEGVWWWTPAAQPNPGRCEGCACGRGRVDSEAPTCSRDQIHAFKGSESCIEGIRFRYLRDRIQMFKGFYLPLTFRVSRAQPAACLSLSPIRTFPSPHLPRLISPLPQAPPSSKPTSAPYGQVSEAFVGKKAPLPFRAIAIICFLNRHCHSFEPHFWEQGILRAGKSMKKKRSNREEELGI